MKPATGESPVAARWSNRTLTQIRSAQMRRTFAPSVLAVSVAIIAIFFCVVRYVEMDERMQEQIDQFYQFLIHVNFMIFVGFGFLMTFLRRYPLGAVSLNFFASVMIFLEAILCIGVCQQVIWNQKDNRIRISIPLLIDSCFAAGSGMIAFGAVIGKTTPTQLMWLMFAQVPLYALNQRIVIYTFKALDMGGTLVIHLFGCYYGLAASLMFSRKQVMHGLDHPKNGSAYLNDVFSMIGTLFLWLYWPSFNGALAAVEGGVEHAKSHAHAAGQFLSCVNTLISLLGSALSTFLATAVVDGQINMVHVQNSALAGGVAMGAACTLKMTPGGALVVGFAAGILSVLGFKYLTPFLDRTIGLGDTCGIHNLHGMPAILGGLVAGLAALGQDTDFLFHSSGGEQLWNQILAMLVTMGIAISWGLLMGWLVATLNPTSAPPLGEMMPAELFDDGAWFHEVTVEPLPMTKDESKHSVHLAAGEPVHGMPMHHGDGKKADFESVFACPNHLYAQECAAPSAHAYAGANGNATGGRADASNGTAYGRHGPAGTTSPREVSSHTAGGSVHMPTPAQVFPGGSPA